MRVVSAFAVSLVFCSTAWAALVWVADFNTDGNTEGFVEFQDGNPAKTMFAGPVGGSLFTTVQDGVAFGGEHDKGGKSLGSIKNPGTDDFSAYLRVSWLTWPSAQSYSYVGFTGVGGTVGDPSGLQHITSEAVGSALWQQIDGNGDHLISLGATYSPRPNASGTTGGDVINLGQNPIGQTFQIGIFWNHAPGINGRLLTGLYDAAGNLLGGAIRDVGELAAGKTYAEIAYLGWQDWVAFRTNEAVVWSVDQVKYYDTWDGPVTAGDLPRVPEPATAWLLACGLGALLARRPGR